MGWRKGSQLPTLFADLVIRMKPGEFSEPLQSAGGFQIVRLNDMRGAERTMVDQLHVRHILLRPNEILDEAAVQQKALGIREQIVGGDDFATVAEAVSEDPASAAEGGDFGWLSPGDTVPEFEQAMAELPINELSEPIKTRFGWHLIEVLERRSHDTTDEVKRDAMRAPDPRGEGRGRARAVGAAAARPGVRRHPPLKRGGGREPAPPARVARAVTKHSPLIVVSSGEPAGIGPDISLALASRPFAARIAVLGDLDLLETRARLLGSASSCARAATRATSAPHEPGRLQVLPIALPAPRRARQARHAQRGVRARDAAPRRRSSASRARRRRS